MTKHGLTLDFSNQSVTSGTCKVWARKRTIIPANSEYILWGKVPKHLQTGYQGICSGSVYVHKQELLVARSIGVVSTNSMVPIKILNPTPNPLTIHKGKPIGRFQVLAEACQIHSAEPEKSSPGVSPACAQASFQTNDRKKQSSYEFSSNFDLQMNEWSKDEQERITQLLLDNRDLFVTPDNLDLGLTRVVNIKSI